MRLYIFLISIVCCTGISRAQYNPQINELKWSDEFNYEGVPDPAKWSYEEGLVRNEEAQYYTKEREKNVRVENGCLVIEAHKEKYGNMEYTSGSIHTNDKLEFRHPTHQISFHTLSALDCLHFIKSEVKYERKGTE